MSPYAPFPAKTRDMDRAVAYVRSGGTAKIAAEKFQLNYRAILNRLASENKEKKPAPSFVFLFT